MNPWKNRLCDEPLFGCFVTFASPALSEMTARLGFDFLVIDNEHGTMNEETLENMVRGSHAADVPAVVRVPYNRTEYLRKALDFGADGVQVPLVDTADLARRAAGATLFPPRGDRGVAFLTRAAAYGMHPDKGRYLTEANDTRLVAVHIETVQALDNLDAILDVDDIDVFFVGPGDLAISMGHGDDPNHPDVLAAIDTGIKTIRSRGKIAGTYVGSTERAKQVIDLGATYILTALVPHMIEGGSAFLRDVRPR